MQGFAALSSAASKDGVLDQKTKELIAVALGIAARCDDCIAFHIQAAIRLGMTMEELQEVIGMAVMMGGGPSLMYGSHAIAAFKEFSEE
ncbi:MAG: carboxymuconolactone decarboxylase family protein [Alcaligenaceae bacterium]|nr:carboxymuconolactone decarboxylase family protein [Alcaligenaceae bacterium]